MRGPRRFIVACLLFLSAAAFPCRAEESAAQPAPTESETIFLDRLMLAESGGRQFARNRASSAVGPFQFLGATFLGVVRRNLPALASGKSDAQILALRTDLLVSRNVALIYTRENASALAAKGKEATGANLRLAFFAGAAGAMKVLEAGADEPVSHLLSEAAIAANPFLRDMTASGLLARAEREASGLDITLAERPKPTAIPPGIAVHCHLALASCRHWLALAEKRLVQPEASSLPVRSKRSSELASDKLYESRPGQAKREPGS